MTTRRSCALELPAPQPVNQSFSLWDILKQSMGKDLSRISMPANINQPLSTLQRMTEDFEYLHLLYDAVDGGSGINRMTALVGFVASSYASWYGRQQKPFAPTLGETYDWTSPDGRVRVVCEQVIYADPPACAFRATGTTPGGRRFVVDGEGAGISKFWGKYVQIVVQGGLHMELPDTGETFSWSKASMHVHNVISGRIWIDMVGEVTVLAHKTGESAKFRLLKGKRPEPGKPDVRGKIDGEVYDAAGNCVAHVQGNVLGKVWARPDPTYVPPPGGEALHERFRVGEGRRLGGGGDVDGWLRDAHLRVRRGGAGRRAAVRLHAFRHHAQRALARDASKPPADGQSIPTGHARAGGWPPGDGVEGKGSRRGS